ncbi:hypothetical protein [Cellulophaga fucicola]|uniref:hypothetical protein n=1 Tax=Cellulophaga fucicola TaxID=76595 RepID=UPI003EBD7DC8
MLERLLLKHLTKKGKIAYFVGLVASIALVAFIILGVADYSLDSGKDVFFVSIVAVNLIWAGVCYFVWRKKEEENQE